MKYIDKLLQGAPVEWKTLGEVLVRTRGTKITARQMKDLHKEGAPIKIFAGGKTIAYISYNDLPKKDICYEPSIIVKSRGIIGFEYYDKPFSHKNELWAYHSEDESISIKYVYYYLVRMENVFQRIGSVMQMPQISIPDTDNYKIPIPPLAVQEEVVRVLDTFTTLEAELEAELDCRKRQYQYYRDALLSFVPDSNDGLCHSPLIPTPFAVEWRPLGEVGEFTRGSGLQKKDFTTEGVGCIHYGQIYTHYGTFAFETKTFVSEEFAQKARKAQFGDLVIATTSENDEDLCKAVAWLGKEAVVVSSDACFYTHKMAPKYVSYFFQTTHFQKQKRTFITGTKVRRVNAKDLAKIGIPIPPLAVQERIVEILDKFDTLANSISEGLPREIELRCKQYAYYRDALLTF